jgi:class 3 adenylate cyclase
MDDRGCLRFHPVRRAVLFRAIRLAVLVSEDACLLGLTAGSLRRSVPRRQRRLLVATNFLRATMLFADFAGYSRLHDVTRRRVTAA